MTIISRSYNIDGSNQQNEESITSKIFNLSLVDED